MMVCYSCVASLAVSLWGLTAEAAEYRRLDGVHRVEKKAQITERAVLDRRADSDNVCATSWQLCPSSLDGGCCPDNYDCAKESCYATTKGPSTCGTKVGWYNCDAVYGAGCCPDGYLCQTADNCVPPSGSPYTLGCPASHYLCPSSASYGCCPDGMGCAVNQCYSTEASTITTTLTITTTDDGVTRTIKTTATTVTTPEAPTKFPEVDSGEDDDQKQLKYFPSVVAKVTPSSTPDDDDDDGGGLSTGQLGGIVAGAVAFLIIILVGAYIIIRHLNKVVAAVSSTKQSESSNARPPMKHFKPTDSEIDALSVDPLMMSPRPSYPGRAGSSPDFQFGHGSPDPSFSDQTPTSFGGAYQIVSPGSNNSRHAILDEMGNVVSYFDALPARPARFSQTSSAAAAAAKRGSNDSQGTYGHLRHYSNASEGSTDTETGGGRMQTPLNELEATPYVPELMGSSAGTEERRRSSASATGGMPRPPLAHQRKRSESRTGREQAAGTTPLGVVSEEIHGFHGPSDRMMGQTAAHRPETNSSGGPGESEIGGGENSRPAIQ